ncbi:hypothetical protein WICPIJ_003280 [Wickerhamomyces pijperi]|uniref:Efficient mitochondria targeting-associated protein 19 n=1 Tax=Wickerhamomyces pijperi TaxID=599730 RepID=A0A9P8TPE1_WICPI|nr:hypothetical protein WICPIJ_003280 [Wickerhamomyces pijperi]
MSAANAEKLSPVYSQKDPLFSLRTKLDTFYFLYCVLHLVITCLIDIVLVVPREYLTEFQLNLINFHISEYKDFLLQDPPKWLVLFGWVEVLFQLPLFLFGAISLYQRRSKVYPYLFVYGIEASLTTLVCMVVIALNGEAHGMTTEEIQKLEMLYSPILAISVFLSVDMLFNRIWYDSTTTEKKQI